MWPTGVGHLRDYSSSSIIFPVFPVDRKLTDTFRQFVYRHRIPVMLPQELRFGNTLRTRFHFTGIYQLTLNGAFAFGQLFQQRRGDGQAVTASQFQNFANVTEACAHHDGFIAVLLVILVDFADGNYARIFCRCVLFLVGVGFVPVEDTANERRNQEDARFGASASLSEGEQQRQVTVNASFSSCSAARMPCAVEASLIRMRSLLMPASLYSLMMRLAFAIDASVS